jgi:hypothetical protein
LQPDRVQAKTEVRQYAFGTADDGDEAFYVVACQDSGGLQGYGRGVHIDRHCNGEFLDHGRFPSAKNEEAACVTEKRLTKATRRHEIVSRLPINGDLIQADDHPRRR